jgi:hypothetical protein
MIQRGSPNRHTNFMGSNAFRLRNIFITDTFYIAVLANDNRFHRLVIPPNNSKSYHCVMLCTISENALKPQIEYPKACLTVTRYVVGFQTVRFVGLQRSLAFGQGKGHPCCTEA